MSEFKQNHACIDLGSNMCRLLIGQSESDKPLGFNIVRSYAVLISLGKNDAFINQRGVHKTTKAVEQCKALVAEYRCSDMFCIATAIFRSAYNAEKLLKLIESKMEVSFRIIDPGEEIMLSAFGCRDILLNGHSFVMDMGGGSTEVGLFYKQDAQIDMLGWVSLPCGLFFFSGRNLTSKPMPPDSHKVLNAFLHRSKSLISGKSSLVICRSGIMSIISTFLCKKNNISKTSIHGRVFEKRQIIKTINTIMDMSDVQILQQKLVSNSNYLCSIKGMLIFTKELLNRLPVEIVILGNGGVKEGMMYLACQK